jgi:predicted MPP superfamily phosphohydrolase
MSPGARFAVFLTVVLAVWLGQHLYTGWRLLSVPGIDGVARRVLLGVFVVGFLAYPVARWLGHLGLVAPARVLEVAGGVWMGVVFLLLATFLAVDVITLGGLVLKPWLGWLRGGAAALAAAGAAAALVGACLPPRVVAVEVEVPGLPAAADGLVAVQVSDLHLGSATGRGRLRRVVEQVRAAGPDVVLLTGDLIDADEPMVAPHLGLLQQLAAPLGTFAVLGNHEFYAGPGFCRSFLAAAGATVLDNRAVEVAPGVVVAGVPDDGGARQTGHPGADLGAALAGVDAAAAVILMQHAPTDPEAAAAAGVNVMLSGHTHGGQMWPFHHLVRLQFPRYAGVHRVDGLTLVVSRGAGWWGPPMRLLARADVVRLTLRRPGAGG